MQNLLAKIRENLEIVEESICFGQYRLTYYRPADPEAVLDDETLMSAHDQLDWQPYWAQAWDAGLGMCQYLSTQMLAGKTVLDLGCGVGLTSALLAASGANVVCGDNAPPSLLFAEANTWPWRQRVTVQLIDWHKTRVDCQFDLIVGSDIVYDRAEVTPLNRFFRAHLGAGGEVLLSDPSRPMTREYLAAFQELGWQLVERTIRVADVKQPIRLVHMTLPGQSSSL